MPLNIFLSATSYWKIQGKKKKSEKDLSKFHLCATDPTSDSIEYVVIFLGEKGKLRY
jgi:hypothetical protein